MDTNLEAGRETARLFPVQFVHGLNAPREQYVDNIRANLTRHDIPSLKTKRALLVAGGPSAADHLDDIRARKAAGCELFTVNGAHDWLIGQGIFPDYCVLLEANEVVNTFVRKPYRDCLYLLASQCHPSLVDRLEGLGLRVMLWHAEFSSEATKLIEALDPNPTIFAAAQTVGLNALGIAYTFGVKNLAVYGMDSSIRDSGDHAYDNSQQHDYETIEFEFAGKTYRAHGTWASQAETFARMWPAFFRKGMTIEVIGDGLLPAMAAQAKARMIQEMQSKGVTSNG